LNELLHVDVLLPQIFLGIGVADHAKEAFLKMSKALECILEVESHLLEVDWRVEDGWLDVLAYWIFFCFVDRL